MGRAGQGEVTRRQRTRTSGDGKRKLPDYDLPEHGLF